ncbi:MAG: BREX-2 system phosphatase PglZ [Opitutales bacterium]|nr:BREX-2 system phosphatase PglZ [Opitutales bacterium]
MITATPGQIRAQVSAIRKKVRNGAQAYALRVSGWTGPDRLQIEGDEHLVVACGSDLQAREALLLARLASKPVVLLFLNGHDQLGEDVMARLAKQRVVTPDAGEMLGELFSANLIDPRVLASKPLVNALLERVAPGGYRPVAGGVLDLQHAWAALLEQALGTSFEDPSLTQVLEWSKDPRKVKTLADFGPELRQAFVEWFSRTRGESIRFMMAAVEAGAGADLIPLGFALGLIFSKGVEGTPDYHAVRGRLENRFGGKDIDAESARAWFRAAEAITAPLNDGPRLHELRTLLKRVDALLCDLKLQSVAHFSNHSLLGFEGRFDRLGEALQKALKSRQPRMGADPLEALARINEHAWAGAEADRIERAEMALRLLVWLQGDGGAPAADDLPGFAEAYHRDGGFLDWARNRLRETDGSAPLQAAYAKILKQVDERILEGERRFSTLLADWTRGEDQSDRLIPIEDVLAKVVIPVAKVQPVLLLVLDGLSVAVFRQLLRDITQQDWAELSNDTLGLPRPVLAALPSLTQISRRALFLGKLAPAASGTEKGEFAGNDFLFQATGSQTRPRLFLKGDLQEEGHGGIAAEVKKAIADKKCRTVGVVVNAIDDHLDSGDQVVFTWSVKRIKPLRELLQLSAEAERLVILTSDHGHVLDFGSKKRSPEGPDFGDRYRIDNAAPLEGETVFEGKRIAQGLGRNRIVLAWSGDLRYGAKKRGYHGGSNPQEVVVPLAILSNAHTPPAGGWKEIPHYEPSWWRLSEAEMTATAGAPVAEKATEPVDEAVRGLDLFEHFAAKESQTEVPWIEKLLATEIYQEQRKLAARSGTLDEVVVRLLETMEARGGTVMKAPLAQALGIPLFRVDGLVQNVCRILNVDGYEVLAYDRSTESITLNLHLLKTQFDVT